MSGVIYTGRGSQLNVPIICDVERIEKRGPGGKRDCSFQRLPLGKAMGDSTANLEGGGGVTPISDEYISSRDVEAASECWPMTRKHSTGFDLPKSGKWRLGFFLFELNMVYKHSPNAIFNTLQQNRFCWL